MSSNNHVFIVDYDVGVHVGFNGFLSHSLKFAVEKGMRSCQVFMGDQTSFSRAKIDMNDIIECQKIQNRFPIHFFSHFPFTASLCGSVGSLAWNGDDIQNKKTSFMLRQLENELDVFANFTTDKSRSGVVIHPGCNTNTREGLISISKSINKIKFAPCAKLILENSAGEGKKLCKNFDEFMCIFNMIEPQKRVNVGICIDTAHIHGQGDFDLSTIIGVDDMFEQFEKRIGLEYLSLIHLNDSEVKFGSKKDRHASLKTGEIWGERDDALRHIIIICKRLKIPMIMETNIRDMVTVSMI